MKTADAWKKGLPAAARELLAERKREAAKDRCKVFPALGANMSTKKYVAEFCRKNNLKR